MTKPASDSMSSHRRPHCFADDQSHSRDARASRIRSDVGTTSGHVHDHVAPSYSPTAARRRPEIGRTMQTVLLR